LRKNVLEQATHSPRIVRFGAFEADLRTGELRKEGVKLKFSGQPFQVLAILLERPGDVVTREELQKRLWPDTFVDVDHNLNTAINKIREVLGDSAESPRFVETLSRRGYRFIAPVETDLPLEENKDPIEKPIDKPAKSKRLFRLWLPILGGAAVLAIGLVVWISFFKTAGTPRVVRFTQLTHDGQGKFGPLLTDGVRIYFNEWLADGRYVIAQVSVKGGEVTHLSVPIKAPDVHDLSRDGRSF
jgi:DNA-binding winged helix-turn-helix (wHTH) protein